MARFSVKSLRQKNKFERETLPLPVDMWCQLRISKVILHYSIKLLFHNIHCDIFLSDYCKITKYIFNGKMMIRWSWWNLFSWGYLFSWEIKNNKTQYEFYLQDDFLFLQISRILCRQFKPFPAVYLFINEVNLYKVAHPGKKKKKSATTAFFFFLGFFISATFF